MFVVCNCKLVTNCKTEQWNFFLLLLFMKKTDKSMNTIEMNERKIILIWIIKEDEWLGKGLIMREREREICKDRRM